MAALAVAACFLLPLLAASVVRGALARAGAADRAAYASGASPWSWRFASTEDVVAGRAFGNATIEATIGGLTIHPNGDGRGEVGFPLSRQADLDRLNLLHLDADATGGTFDIAVRPVLTGELVRASLPGLAPAIRLDDLSWHDVSGNPVAPPARAAMLRLGFRLPPGDALTLRGAGLASANGPAPALGIEIPTGMTAEGLLRWRDRQQARDPLATFGHDAPGTSLPSSATWIAPAVYAALLVAAGVVTRRRRAPSRWSDLANAALGVAGPLWFIAGLGLSTRPAASAVSMFALGVAYGAYLTWIQAIPRWHWRGGWRMAGWPLIALPVAVGIAAVAGHAPAWPPIGRAALYVGWAFFQQWLMLAVVAGLLARALPRPAAVLLTALAFALLHTPNGLLMQLCFVAELGWAWWYLHHRSLLPVAFAHAGAAIIMQACMAGGVLRSLEVSARFLS